MDLNAHALHPLFGAELRGLTIKGAASAEERAAFLESVHTYGIVLLRNQSPSEAQIGEFAKSLGPIWTIASSVLKDSPHINEATSVVYHYTNRGKDGKPIPADDPLMLPTRVNEHWHTDSTYSRPGASMSIFAGRVVPPEGGNTEFCDTRVAFESLNPAFQERLRSITAQHSLVHSLSRVGSGDVLKGEDRKRYSAIQRPLVNRHESGRFALCLASHIGAMDGMSNEESEKLLRELVGLATTPDRVYSHKWRPGDVIVWDNRCTMHRATPYESEKHLREMWIVRLADQAEM